MPTKRQLWNMFPPDAGDTYNVRGSRMAGIGSNKRLPEFTGEIIGYFEFDENKRVRFVPINEQEVEESDTRDAK